MNTAATGRDVICLMVPNGSWRLAPLVEAVRDHHPARLIVAVWCGDPHLRPSLGAVGLEWCDFGLDEPSGAGWSRLLVALRSRHYEWCRAAAAVARLLDHGAGSVTVLRVGSVAVLGPLDVLSGSAALTLIARADGPLPADGLAPDDSDVLRLGSHSTVALGCRPGSQPALQWLASRLVGAAGADGDVGPWIDRMADLFDGRSTSAPSLIPVGWPRSVEAAEAPAVVDLDHLDRAHPWSLEFGSLPARVRLSQHQTLAEAIDAARVQCEGRALPLSLPGGIPADGEVRTLMAAALRGWRSGIASAPPDPYGPANSEFTAWLEASGPADADIGRYWLAVRDVRADLQAAFPQPDGLDAAGLREWAAASWRLEDRSAILLPHASASFALPSASDAHAIRSTGMDSAGVNVLGYIDVDQGLGEVARQIIEDLRAAGVPVSALNYHRSHGRSSVASEADRVAPYATNIVVVTAAHFDFVVGDHGQTLLKDRHTIGYWFWELEFVPPAMVRAIDHVDEIWTGSQFIADAFAAVTDKPVHRVSLPVAEPRPSARGRASFGLPDDRFVFLATFDQFSVPERKNPFGVIEAFSRAFADGEGPLLWIKTMNGDRGWRNHERLLLAASRRSDIIVWDEHLSRPDQMAVLAASDCLVSLHRSEGLGLHCAEAMWLSKPVIATRYSGNLDFMDDSCAALVDFELVPVRHGEGIYPESALWAEPDLDQAAAWMQRMVVEPTLAAVYGRMARAKMQSQASAEDVGHSMARLARLTPRKG